MSLFDFRSPAQRKADDEKYAAMIFPRGMQVQDELFSLMKELCPKSKTQWIMLGFVCGKEGVIKLREKARREQSPAPSREQEREAALKRINPKRSKLDRFETLCVLELIFADLAADDGEEMASVSQLSERVSEEEKLPLPVYSKKK